MCSFLGHPVHAHLSPASGSDSRRLPQGLCPYIPLGLFPYSKFLATPPSIKNEPTLRMDTQTVKQRKGLDIN